MKEFYTAKEISDLLGVSKTAIQKTIKKAHITPDKEERNKFYYEAETTKRIIKAFRPNFDFSVFDLPTTETDNQEPKTENSTTKTDNQETDNSKNSPENSTTETDNPTTKGEKTSSPYVDHQIIKELQRTITVFEKELQEKNEQIKSKDRQIEKLTNTIDKLNDTIQGQILLTAQEKKLIEAESNEQREDTDQKPEKVSFFRSFFKRKKESG